MTAAERLDRARRDVARGRHVVANRGPLAVESILAPHEQSLLALDDEVARLDAVVTAVRDLHQSYDLLGTPSCRTCSRHYPCPTVRALDGGAS